MKPYEGKIVERLSSRYQWPHWLFLPGLRGATGFETCRTIDALAHGIYHSRGQEMIGFEVKISRGDWLRELKNPAKADALAAHCDFWFVVVPDDTIVKVEELPRTWGLMTVDCNKKRGGIKIIKDPKRIAPKPLPRAFRCSLLQRAYLEAQTLYSQNTGNGGQYTKGYEAAQLAMASEVKQLADLRKQLADFEKASGIHITTYSNGESLGRAAQAISRPTDTQNVLRQLEDCVRTMENTLSNFKLDRDAVKNHLFNLGVKTLETL